MQINGYRVRRVLVVDDDPGVREVYEFALEELKLEAVFEAGPLRDVAVALRSLRRKADALVCDYHLRKRNYSLFDGDLFVAESYKRGVPGLLCTSYNDFDITLMRTKRRFIPSLVKAEEVNPDNIVRAFTRCIFEREGRFDPSRKPWRALVRVEEVVAEQEYCYVVVPAWRPEEKIRLFFDDLAPGVRGKLREGLRFHAEVNIGVDRTEELYFANWEAA